MKRSACRAAVVLLALVALPCPAQDRAAAETAFDEGRSAMEAGDHERAAAAFERAAALAPDSTVAIMNLGIARAALRDWDGAIAAYQSVLALDPASYRAHNNIANVLFRQGDYDAALLAYREAVRINPGYLLAVYHLGWTARQLDRLEEAERAFRRCLEFTPADDGERSLIVEARYYLGAIRFRFGDHADAASLMEEVIAASPAHEQAHYYLGQSYLRLGRREEGLEHLLVHKTITERTLAGGAAATAEGP